MLTGDLELESATGVGHRLVQSGEPTEL